MTDILGLITGLLGWLVGAILALAGAWIAGNRQGRQRAAQKADRATISAMREVRKHEREAETQDDTALVDRLTRKP